MTKTVWQGEWSAAVSKTTTGRHTVTVAKNYIWVATFVATRDDSPRFRNGVHTTSRWGAECVHVRDDAALANEDRADIPSSIDFAMWKDTLACCITACLQVCINAERDHRARQGDDVTKPKIEGRTQLVGYAITHRLVENISTARKMDLEQLRRVVELHRTAVAAQNKKDGIDDASMATTAEGEEP